MEESVTFRTIRECLVTIAMCELHSSLTQFYLACRTLQFSTGHAYNVLY